MAKATCAVEDCEEPIEVKVRGWCSKHYKRWQRHGDPQALLRRRHSGTPEERFWAKVERSASGCWLWTGGKYANGYGVFTPSIEQNVYAHRYAYELLVGPIPDGLPLDHLCRVRHCVNPTHLEPVTPGENNRRAAQFRRRKNRDQRS